MTDQQIITDICPYQGECSVSGCKRNDDGCFVRQLFEERDRAEKRIVELNETIQAKEQECEDLKKQYNCYACGTCKGKEDYKNLETHHIGLRKSFDELHKQLDQLKQTLAEIKEICNSVENIENINSLYDAKLSGMYLQANKILQKISESEVENE